MAKIRNDIDGVVLAFDANGTAVTLNPGDTVPDGVDVGDHVLAGKAAAEKPAPVDGPTVSTGIPPRAGRGSNVEAWREYAQRAATERGLNIDFPDDVKRDEIIEALSDAGIPVE